MVKLYSAGELAVQLVEGAAPVLSWVGSGVSAAVVLMFIFLGIRAGFRFFQGLVWDRRLNEWTDEDEALDREYMARASEITR